MEHCPCCGYKTLGRRGDYEICPICFWEDDIGQEKDPGSIGGANKVSLREAQRNFMKFGACDKESIKYVRKPLKTDVRDPIWKTAK